jgi:hypothetical protein
MWRTYIIAVPLAGTRPTRLNRISGANMLAHVGRLGDLHHMNTLDPITCQNLTWPLTDSIDQSIFVNTMINLRSQVSV